MQKLIDYVFNLEKTQGEQQMQKPLIVKRLIKGYDADKWADAFYANDQSRTFRHTKRTVLRHEIISFSSKSDISREQLRVLSNYYLKHRSPKSMCVGAVHWDESPHVHFIISGVAIDGSSTRISRQEFKQFKVQLQEFQQERFPDLADSIVQHTSKKKAST